jgi:hypothetical protein
MEIPIIIYLQITASIYQKSRVSLQESQVISSLS